MLLSCSLVFSQADTAISKRLFTLMLSVFQASKSKYSCYQVAEIVGVGIKSAFGP